MFISGLYFTQSVSIVIITVSNNRFVGIGLLKIKRIITCKNNSSCNNNYRNKNNAQKQELRKNSNNDNKNMKENKKMMMMMITMPMNITTILTVV